MAYKIKTKKLKEKPYETRTYRVYKFENLPKEAQERALERYRYMGVENENLAEQDDFLIDMGLDKKTLKIAEKKVGKGNTLFSWKTAYYDFDRNQYVQFVDLKVKDDEAFRQELGISKKTWNKVDYSFENPSRETNTRIAFTTKDGSDAYSLPKKEGEELDKATERFNYLMREANKNLEKDYHYRVSDEYVRENLEANEYKFNLKGEID